MSAPADAVEELVPAPELPQAEGRLPYANSEDGAWSPDRLEPHGEGVGPAELVRTTLLNAYRVGDDWADMFDRLTPAEVDSLKALFSHMPPRAARHFAERFIIPTR